MSHAIDGAPAMLKANSTLHGSIVAIVGPDGTGKSTTIEQLSKELISSSSEVSGNIRHWRPRVLPPLGRLTRMGSAESESGGPPRRSPGRFQFLRLAYYGLDFIVGHFVQDRPEKLRNQVILYDRCALDMHVDPVRFGLKSARGTRLLWKVIPKPDAVVLLYDAPARILGRKAELSSAEIERQFAVWLKLFSEEQVDAVVRINSKPIEVARRIASYLRGQVRSSSGDLGGQITQAHMLNSVLRMLAGAPATSDSNITDAHKGPSDPKGKFAVVPSLKAPRFLIPLESRKPAVNSLRTYSAQKPLARSFKWGLATGLRLGIAQPLLRQRVSIQRVGSDNSSVLRDCPLDQFLAQALGKSEVFLGVSLGTPTVHQKPLIQVMDREGRPLGYAKIGWNRDTISIVENEAEVLKRLSPIEFENGMTPRALITERWKEYYVLLQSGPPSEGWRPSRKISARHFEFVRELSGVNLTRSHLQKSSWWRRMQERIARLDESGEAYDADLVRWTLDESAERFGETEVSFGMKHGDFAPWNLLEKNGALFALDWEYADSDAPLGSDLFHFIIQRAVLAKEARPNDLVRDILGETPLNQNLRSFFAKCGFENDLVQSFLALYVADTLSWHLNRDHNGNNLKSRRTRDSWRFILVDYVLRKAKSVTS